MRESNGELVNETTKRVKDGRMRVRVREREVCVCEKERKREREKVAII